MFETISVRRLFQPVDSFEVVRYLEDEEGLVLDVEHVATFLADDYDNPQRAAVALKTTMQASL